MDNREHSWLALVLAGYLVLALAYATVNPVFESPDELYHFGYVEYLLRERRLPVAETQQGLSEFHQPPLYYLLAASIAAPAWQAESKSPEPPAQSELPERNPFWAFRIGEVGVDNKSQFVHGPNEEFPWRGWVLRVHLARLLSILLQSITIVATYRVGREIFPGQPAIRLGSLAFVAFLPQFLYIASSISNDNLIIPLTSLLIWLWVRGLRTGLNGRWSIAVGVLTGAAVLAKMSGLTLIPFSLAVALLIGWRARSWRQTVLAWGVIAGAAVGVAGPVLLRNQVIYGEPTALGRMSEIWGQHDPPLPLVQALREMPNVWTSYWARFGYGQIPVPNVVYGAALVLTLLAGAGLALWFLRNRRSVSGLVLWQLCLLVAVTVLFGCLVVSYVQVSLTGSNGRFDFPALPAYGTLMFLGLSGWFARRYHRALVVTVHATMGAFALAALVFVLRPAYQAPAMLDSLRAPEHPVALRYGDQAVLHGYGLDRTTVLPGQDLTVTLYWEALQQMDVNDAVFVHLLGPNGEILGARDTYPGLGRLPTSRWRQGKYLVDSIPVPVDSAAASVAPAAAQIEVGLYDLSTMERLPITDVAGQSVAFPVIGRLKLAAASQAGVQPTAAARYAFGDEIALLGYDLPAEARAGEALPLTLFWQPLAQPTQDYTVFVHVLDEAGNLVAQSDAPPRAGAYPTSLWAPPEIITDRHTIILTNTLAAGEYHIQVGLYVLDDGRRLPVLGDDGQVLSDYAPLLNLRLDP